MMPPKALNGARRAELPAGQSSSLSVPGGIAPKYQHYATARCSKHQSWFIIFFKQQEDKAWLAVGAVPVSDHVVNSTVSRPSGVSRATSNVLTGVLISDRFICPYCDSKMFCGCSCGTLNCNG